MRSLLALIIFVGASGCTAPDPGSRCSDGAVRVIESTSVDLPSQIATPVLFYRSFDGLITMDGKSVEKIIRERESISPTKARELRDLIGGLEVESGPQDADYLLPEWEGLEANDLQEALQLANEVNVLFLTGLERGEATLSVNDRPVGNVLVQRYTEAVPNGEIRGKRVVVAGNLVYDYCGVWPKET